MEKRDKTQRSNKKLKYSDEDNYKTHIEWTKQKTLEFIQDYKQHRVLWNPSLKSFNRIQRLNAILELANKYNCNVEFIRNKIKCLRSSFHREYSKYKQRQNNGDNIYEPVWFAYENMKFIVEPNGEYYDGDDTTQFGHDSFGDGFLNYDCLELKSSDDDILDKNLKTNENYQHDANNFKSKDIKTEISFESDEILDKKRNESNYLNFNQLERERDEFQVFGEHVALTLKRLKSDKAEIVAKYLINNILFEAEMGKFDNGLISSPHKLNFHPSSSN